MTTAVISPSDIAPHPLALNEPEIPAGLQWHADQLALLPFLRSGVTAHYEGSIDKLGGNADWDWWLYQDERGEWVLLDVDGPGCLHHFVQHRYPSCPEPTFRFYFDGETEARYSIRLAEFGKKAPFLSPLSDIFEGDDVPPRGRGPIYVVRSMVPMEFQKGCRITSSVKLEGFDREKGDGGGWGHAIYHRYSEKIALPEAPKAVAPVLEKASGVITADHNMVLLEQRGAGSVTGWKLKTDSRHLHDLWVRMEWDGASRPAVWAPIGAFFGNEFGRNRIGFLTHGQQADGVYYCRFPMPFWQSARISLFNRNAFEAVSVESEIELGPEYPRDRCGYFRATDYYPSTKVTPDRDSLIGEAACSGHIVAATLTGRAIDGKYVSCEGDVRLHIDGCTTPKIESDGSESHAGYGWGFVYPPQQNPFSGYDGTGDPLCEFSETRVHVADVIPFRSGFRFGLEAGDRNDAPMRHSGLILYYGRDAVSMVLSDTLDIGDAASEASHEYRAEKVSWQGTLEARYEDESSKLLADRGVAHSGRSEFSVKIDPANIGIRLRRRSDQALGRQRAQVFVDDVLVEEYDWYFADRNPHRRWLEDEFEVPARYTAGKSSVRIRLEHVAGEGAPSWSEFYYWTFSHLG